MTFYACSSVHSYMPPGGVCSGHSLKDRPADPDFPGLSVDCDACAPFLSNHPFWATEPDEVPLTAAEEKQLEREKRQLEVDALAAARADQEYLRKQRLAEEEAAPAAKPRTRKASGSAA